MRVRVWMFPDGTVRQSSFAPWMTPAEVEAETARLALQFPGATWQEMEQADLPPRAVRHRWRHQNGRVIDDPSIPDPPDPKQALRDEVQNATSLAALKAALLKVLG